MVRAKKSKDSVKGDDPLFVGLGDSDSIKRSVLETSKGCLILLKKMEEIKALRKKKVDTMADCNRQFRELRTLVSSLKRKLPISAVKSKQGLLNSVEGKVEGELESSAQGKPVSSKKSQKKAPAQLSEIEKLEAEIAAIEGRLGDV